jgi:hypothetical protein
MIVEKLSPILWAQIAMHLATEKISVFLWIDETKKDTLIQYSVEHRVPGFLVLTEITIDKLARMTHEPWLMLVTTGQSNDSRINPTLSSITNE